MGLKGRAEPMLKKPIDDADRSDKMFTHHRPINRQNRWFLIITETVDAGGPEPEERDENILSGQKHDDNIS